MTTPSPWTPRRRRIAFVVGSIAVAAALLFWRYHGRDASKGSIVGLVAVDSDTAVVLWQANYQNGPSRSWVGVVDGKGRTRWVRSVPDLAFTVGPGNGLVVAGDVVAVRYSHQKRYTATDHAIAAYSLRDGRPLWDITLGAYQPRAFDSGGQSEPSLPIYHSAFAVGRDLLAVWADDGREWQLFGVATATGKIVSHQPSDDHSMVPLTIGSRVITHYVNQTTIFDVTGGSPAQRLDTHYEGCVIGDEYVAIESGADAPDEDALVALRGADPAARRVIAKPFHPIGHTERFPRLRRCGRYRDRLVMLIETNMDGLGDDRTFVVITDSAGGLLHTIDLGRDIQWDGDNIAKRYPDSASLGGELPRFVPYIQHTVGLNEADVTRLIMLDLESGRVAWAAPDDHSFIYWTLFRSGSRWYAYWPNTSWTLSVFDGATGQLSAAVRFNESVGDVLPYHVVGDRVWIGGRTSTTFDAAQVALLDGATLAPVFTRGVKITDVTAKARESLGAR